MYIILFDPSFQAILDGMKERNPKGYNNVIKKIRQVAGNLEMNPNYCKNLKAPLQKYKRVHVNKSFVIVFQVDKTNKLMTVYDYDHHKRIYKKSL